MRKRTVVERVFKCSVCGTKAVAYKKSSHRTEEGHQKHMWCYKCMTRTAFIQQSKWD
jgi:transcription elongation factor Elf1